MRSCRLKKGNPAVSNEISNVVGVVSRRAFTLIELLIVVAIIAILAAIATPNFLEAQTRSKLARVKADMRTLTTALESYGMDNNAYPAGASYFTPMPSVRFNPLTTPIAYITSVPRDPFTRITGNNYEDSIKAVSKTEPLDVYVYNQAVNQTGLGGGDTKRNRMSWSLTSGGPDRYIAYPYYAFSDDSIETGTHITYVYDASNGTLSYGEIFRRGGLGRTPLPEFNN